MHKPSFLGKDFVAERMKLNGKVTTVFKPKKTTSLEEFAEEIKPIIEEMSEKKRKEQF